MTARELPAQYGPAIITIFGTSVPVLSFAMALGGLLLARMIAPASVRKLTKKQEWALTLLLIMVAFLAVAGKFGNPPMEEGVATLTGIGLGFSGLVVIETIGKWFMSALDRMLKAAGYLFTGDHRHESDQKGTRSSGEGAGGQRKPPAPSDARPGSSKPPAPSPGSGNEGK